MTSQPYGGIVGNTVADSTPWWPDPITPPPNSVMVVLNDIGFADLLIDVADDRELPDQLLVSG